VSSDTRNVIVAISLIASLTLGAGVLLWLEPPVRGWSESALLMARNGVPVEQVEIVYVPDSVAVSPQRYDCVIYADGHSEWQASGSHIRLAVVGDEDSERLGRRQAQALLAVLGNLEQGWRLGAGRVRLAPESDPRVRPQAPPATQELMQLLLKKGIIR